MSMYFATLEKETYKRSFINAFSICMTVPVSPFCITFITK